MPIITFICNRPGSRVPRMIAAMHKRGWTCRVLTREGLWRHGDLCEAVDQWLYPRHIPAYIGQDAEHPRPADVYLVSQEPEHDWMAGLAVAQRNLMHEGKPITKQRVLWDVRDMDSLSLRQVAHRQLGELSPPGQYPSVWEPWNSSRVDGLVHVSPECRDTFHRYYPWTKDVPTAVVRSFVGEDQRCEWPAPEERSGVVYCGGISSPFPDDGAQHTRSYGEEFHAILGGHPDAWDLEPACIQSADFARTPHHDAWEELGVMVLPRVSQENLVRALSRFRWGLVGFPISYPIGEAAGPNKLGEYLAAGVVPVAVRCRAAQAFLEDHGIGLGGRTMEECLPRMTRETWEWCYQNLAAKVAKFTMEEEANYLDRVCRAVMKRPVRSRDVDVPEPDVWDPVGLELERRIREASAGAA